MIHSPDDINAALPALLDVSAAADFLVQCQDWVAHTGGVHLDASAVERITTPSFQMLLAMLKHRRDRSCDTHIHNPSDAFRSAVKFLGLESHLQKEFAHG